MACQAEFHTAFQATKYPVSPNAFLLRLESISVKLRAPIVGQADIYQENEGFYKLFPRIFFIFSIP